MEVPISAHTGGYRDKKFHGEGTYTFSNGEKYTGEYIDDKRNGEEIYAWPNDDMYLGEWRDGKKHGTAWFISKKGNYGWGKMHKEEWKNRNKFPEHLKYTDYVVCNDTHVFLL